MRQRFSYAVLRKRRKVGNTLLRSGADDAARFTRRGRRRRTLLHMARQGILRPSHRGRSNPPQGHRTSAPLARGPEKQAWRTSIGYNRRESTDLLPLWQMCLVSQTAMASTHTDGICLSCDQEGVCCRANDCNHTPAASPIYFQHACSGPLRAIDGETLG